LEKSVETGIVDAVRQWVISVPKRLRGIVADRPAAVAALTRIFLDEIERLLCAAAGVTRAANTPTAARPRLGAVSFLHRLADLVPPPRKHRHRYHGVFAPNHKLRSVPWPGNARDDRPGTHLSATSPGQIATHRPGNGFGSAVDLPILIL
jgi:hypothetical protein